MTPIHFAAVIGGSQVHLLPHLVEHYRARGVESFLIVRHAESASDPNYLLMERYAKEAGVPLLHSHVAPYTADLQRQLLRYAMDEHPDDWYVVADGDEFQVYDRPIPDLIGECERGGYDCVGGCFVDRIGPDGGFPALEAGSLWERYPLAGSVSASIARALPLKVCLAPGRLELLVGQHGAPEAVMLPRSRGYVQVHHFKWTGGVLARLERQLDPSSGSNQWMSLEASRVLAHTRAHADRIDIEDPRFHLRRCGSDYEDHPEWTDIAREAQGWSWAITY